MLVGMGKPEDDDPAQIWHASGVWRVVEAAISTSVRSM
jgi:hypothetical protein